MHCVVLAVTAMYYAQLPVSCEVISIECKSIVCHRCDTPGKVTDEQSFSKFGVAKYWEQLLQSSNGTFVPWGMLSICVCSCVGRVSCVSVNSWLLKLEINLLYCSKLHDLNFCMGGKFSGKGSFQVFWDMMHSKKFFLYCLNLEYEGTMFLQNVRSILNDTASCSKTS